MINYLRVLGVARPNFLVLTPICVALGVAAGYAHTPELNWSLLIPVGLGALLAHIAVNALNEYTDFRSGLDLNTRRTPFSGGSGTLVAAPELAGHARELGWAAVAGVVASGLWIAAVAGWQILPIGLLGVLIVILYSGPINRNRWLVLIAPGVGFGPLMTLGASLGLTGQLTLSASLCSLVVFFQVNNLLLLNQFPDRDPDAAVGRDNWVIASKEAAVAIFAIFAGLAYATLILGVALEALPTGALAGLLTAPLGWRAYRGARRFLASGEPDLAGMGANVIMTLLTPALMSAGIFTQTLFQA